MAQAGYTPISLYYSTTAAAVPTTGNLANGELGLNIADMKLYAKNSAGTVTLLASNAGASGSVTSVAVSGGTTGLTTSGGPITTSGTITLAGTLATTNGGTGLTSFTSGGVVYASSTSALATGSALTYNGTSFGVGSSNYGNAGTINVSVGVPATTTGGIQLWSTTTGVHNIQFGDGTTGSDTYRGYIEYAHTGDTMQFAVAATENMRLNAQALGVGIVPQTGWSGFKAIQIGANTSVWSSTTGGGTSYYSNNLYYNGSNRIYITSGSASEYQQASSNGSHQWYIAPSGTAGNAISLTQAMTLEGTDRANLLVGTTSTSFSAASRGVIEVAGSSTALVSLKGGSALAYIFNDGSNLNIQNNSAGTFQLSNNSAVRFQIGSAGQLGIGGATYGTAGQVLTSGGSGAAPTWAAAGGGSQAFVAFGSTGGF